MEIERLPHHAKLQAKPNYITHQSPLHDRLPVHT